MHANMETVGREKAARMWKTCRWGLICAAALLLAGTLTGCPEAPTDLDGFIAHEMREEHVPALAAAIIKNGKIAWSKGYGYANLAEDRPATSDTLFHLASISKTFTGTAVMQLWEKGLIDLDGDINELLGYSLRNPFYQETPITPRMLLTHTSTLRDHSDALGELYTYGADSPISLGTLIRGMFLPTGEWYDKDLCFLNKTPGTAHEYSNLGFAVLGHIVEQVSGMSFDAYCQEHIFQPLKMEETGWFLSDLDQDHIAMPYRDLGVLFPIYLPYGQYGYPDYPSGQLRTSANQLAHFLIAFMNGGVYDGTSILAPETVDEMFRRQIPAMADYQALPWLHFNTGDFSVVGHAGGEQGTSTVVLITEDKTVGIVLLTTCDPCSWLGAQRVDKVLPAIYERLLQEAQSF